MTERDDRDRVERVARAIGLEIARAPVEPRGGWLRAARAAIAAAEPPGWKLVPVEPTLGMLIAGSDDTDTNANRAEVRRSWAAMVKAAPLPPPPGDGNE
jgi:hypothetical protein